jgi:hypothetical protein
MARKYRARSISSAIVRSEQGSCQWSMPSFIHAVQGNVLWRQGQRDQHREVTMAPCSGSKAAIVLRPAVREPRPTKKGRSSGGGLERPGTKPTPCRWRGDHKARRRLQRRFRSEAGQAALARRRFALGRFGLLPYRRAVGRRLMGERRRFCWRLRAGPAERTRLGRHCIRPRWRCGLRCL